jgi:DNA-binding transcriptional ArsR family regulator
MNTRRVAHIAALVGEPARTGMLLALMDGRALTAHELAAAGHITPATASRHLGLLVEAGLLALERQGRHRYHRLASPEVARMLEGIMQLAMPAVPAPAQVRPGPRDAAMRLARTCYDHLAGGIAVAMAQQLVEEGAVVVEGEAAHVTGKAGTAFERLGLPSEAASAPQAGKRPHCRPCLDWSERRMHLAGRLGALLCTHCLEQGWLLRKANTRALQLTPAGAVALRHWMGVARWQALVQPDR